MPDKKMHPTNLFYNKIKKLQTELQKYLDDPDAPIKGKVYRAAPLYEACDETLYYIHNRLCHQFLKLKAENDKLELQNAEMQGRVAELQTSITKMKPLKKRVK